MKDKKNDLLQEGDKAPNFDALTDEGTKVKLADFKGKNIVLYFYPKDMTSGCTQEACDFRDMNANFKKSKTIILGISKDSVESHTKFKTKYSLPFTLLSDPEAEICKKYGVWKEKSLYGRKYMGIERATFVIGPDQKILKIYPKVKVKGHVEDILNSLKK